MALPQIVTKNMQRALMFLGSRKTAYQLVFGTGGTDNVVPNTAKQFVLDDLKRFCRANRSVYENDEKMTYILIGRHEVFLRIAQHLNMHPEQLYAIYNAVPIQTQQPTGDDND